MFKKKVIVNAIVQNVSQGIQHKLDLYFLWQCVWMHVHHFVFWSIV